MISRLILLAAFVLLYFYCRNRLKNTPSTQRKQLILSWLLWLAVAAVVVMAITGRLHWIGGLLAITVPFVRQFILWFIQKRLGQARPQQQSHQQSQQSSAPIADKNIDVEEALKLLNLEPDFDQQQLTQAHRRMMQKNHPDQGGSDYIAAMINQAKDVLEKELKSRA